MKEHCGWIIEAHPMRNPVDKALLDTVGQGLDTLVLLASDLRESEIQCRILIRAT